MSTPSNTPTPIQNRLTPMTVNRPRFKIQIPSPTPQGNYLGARSPYVNQTQGNNGTPQWPSSPFVNRFSPNDKESMNTGEFLFKQFSGLKDFTVDWTKSGLNHGEKSVFYLYDTISRWSRKWFTHIFLVTIVFLYSILGAYIFIQVEGIHFFSSFGIEAFVKILIRKIITNVYMTFYIY